MVNAPSISLKVIVTTHLILTAWASMHGFMSLSYVYMNVFVLAFGLYAIVSPDNSEAVLMLFITNIAAILMDIIFLGVFVPGVEPTYRTGVYKFSLAMAIINLIVRPISSFIVFKIYQERTGQYADFGVPGLPGFGNAGSPRGGPGYENLDQPVPSNNIESASPHSSIDKSPMP